MIKVTVKDKKIIVDGHADYAQYGSDIVCAAASAIVQTSVNACLKLDAASLSYFMQDDRLTINIKSHDKAILIVIENMIDLLKELSKDYQENIQVKEEK